MIAPKGAEHHRMVIAALVYPRRCPFCERVLGTLVQCPHCQQQLACHKRVVPRLPAGDHCLDYLSGATSVYQYDGCVRGCILRMKNAGRVWYARELGVLMASTLLGCTFRQRRGIIIQESGPVLRSWDLVIPVPGDDRTRGYNLPAHLAIPIAQSLDLPLLPCGLCKTRPTQKQEGKTAQQRMENVRNAYGVPQPQQVEGKRVLLVDDVITTGATVSNCGKALRKAGAMDVFAVTLAATPLL